ncbi:MAG: hypothetical protein JOZ25_11705 [Actinobacteria bacterium]|nr:hypothetical protein [Actinomycetota bacterium]
MNTDRLFRFLARGSSRGNPGRRRRSNRPRGEGEGLVAAVRRLFGRR